MDIKIGNILIDDYLNVKLADFSISYSYKSCEHYIKLDKMVPNALKAQKFWNVKILM